MDVLASPDGETVVTLGTTTTQATFVDWTVVASSEATGERRWVASEAGPGTALDSPSGMAISPDSAQLLVVGNTCESAVAVSTCDTLVVALSLASGAPLWRASLDSGDQDGGTAVTVSPDGKIAYVAGLQTPGATGADASLTALDASDGRVLWTVRYDGSGGFDAGHRLVVSPNGQRVYMTGPSEGATTGKDFATWAFDAEDGRRLWVHRRDDHGGSDQPTALAVEDGVVVVAGTTDQGAQANQANYATVAYDAQSGDQLWQDLYDGGTLEIPLDVSVGFGKVVVTGMSRAANSGYDMATLAYDLASGSRLWAARFNGLANNGDAAWAAEMSADGDEVFVAGDTLLPGAIDYAHAVISYHLDEGTVAWTALHRGGGPRGGSTTQGLDLSPDGGRLYYTGQLLAGPDDSDFLTLAYDAT